MRTVLYCMLVVDLVHCALITGVPLYFSWRLKQEMAALIETRSNRYGSLAALDFKFHSPPAHPNSTAWLGGT